ncbi:Hemerythrin HHE cation binding domain-containing protein [Sphingomonas laterariae]|uniref:Hemerythrin HHE cation binding domain-containing protein n=1 Tax=Edaphosphingomonas laterariae TaxID=861865 RepID=A0A239CH57_9SPHN|nr:hemerythrin domain-containing protein [Sphingomonas laterariae]SNS18673.1 Hemerythrin HHE cation binding domain-containing protein [Sphingomonas laterariae]
MATRAQENRSRTTTPANTAPQRRSAPRSRAASTNRDHAGASTATVLGVAAAGLATGLLANLGRRAAMQAPSALAGDWFEAVKAEHRAALALFDQLQATDSSHPRRRAILLGQLRRALEKHTFTEETVIYPALREWGDKADADKLNHDHGYVKQHLFMLDRMAKDAPQFAMELAEFRIMAEAHMREEERDIFPKLHAALTEENNKTLTSAANWEGFKLA